MAYGRKTGGRRKGSRNKRTLQIEAAGKDALEAVKETLGGKLFEGDAHALLMAVYKNETMPMEMRLDAAKSAVRYEKPALASVDNTIDDKRSTIARVPDPATDATEWLQRYGAMKGEPVQ
jgi:hypothetical protein